MPLFNGAFHHGQHVPYPQGLFRTGPVLPVTIKVPQALEQFLKSQGQPVPPPINGFALIDTGATITGIETSVLSQLGIQPVNQIWLHTASGRTLAYCYPVALILGIPGNYLEIAFSEVAGVQLLAGQPPQIVSAQSPSTGASLISILGRDLLRHCAFIYNGPQAQFTLCL